MATLLILLASIAEAKAPALRLAGTVVGGARPVALLDSGSGIETVRPGDPVGAWTLLEIGPGRVVLENGTRRLELSVTGAAREADLADAGFAWRNPCGRPHAGRAAANRTSPACRQALAAAP